MGKYVYQMVINITDICDMECEFCLRGDGCGRKLDLSLIPRMFEGIDQVTYITITGGEPACYVEAVMAIVDYLADHKDEIHVEGLFIITNGKNYRQELVDAVKTLLFIHVEREYDSETVAGSRAGIYRDALENLGYAFGIAVSMDEYHEPISLMNYLKYRTCGVYSEVKECDYSKGGVIARGRGMYIYGAHDRSYSEFSVESENGTDMEAEEVYVTVEGKVFADCDMSYDMEETYEPAGDLYEETLAQVMERYAKGENDDAE